MLQIYRVAAAMVALGGVASAADLPSIKGPPTFVMVGTNWSGFYVGLNWGTATGQKDWSSPTGLIAIITPRFPASGDQNGLFGGATIGWNYQTGAWVLGVEADIAAANLYGNAVCGGIFGGGGIDWNCKSKTETLGSLTARAGYAVGRALFYLKGGLAYASDKFEIAGLNGNSVTRVNQSRIGWALGGGVEYALGSNWSAKAEYAYYDLGRRAISGVDSLLGAANGASIQQTAHLVKFGLNYRFGGGGADVSAPNPQIANDLSGEIGTRMGWSSGKYRFDLFAPGDPNQMNSRLTWPGQSGLALEGFARLDHISGIFAKGFVGGLGLFNSGHMNDEDFPPAVVPYSNTVSSTKNGNGLYATVDLGYTFLRGNSYRVGGFLGYNHYQAQYHAYGCTQLAASGGICQPAGVIPSSFLILSRHENWNSLRVGLAGDIMVTDRLKLAADFAWLPYMSYGGFDNHWARPDINPLRDKNGKGHNGFQIEGVASYMVTDRLSLGIGARYWTMNAKANVQFPGAALASPTKIQSDRTTVFLQAAYAFGGGPVAPVVAKY